MAIEIKAPQFPESVADGTIAAWLKQPGEACTRDELLAEVETDKVTLEILAPADGVIVEIIKGEDDTVLSEELIARFEAGAAAAPAVEEAPEAVPAAAAAGDVKVSPAARKMIEENNLDAATITATGKGGLITKEDVMAAVKAPAAAPAAKPAPAPAKVAVDVASGDRVEKRVPMTRMRARIAERLLEASQGTAMLTTFNEVDMGPVMELRNKYKDLFEKKNNGTRLGFMSFFVKAATEALKRFPAVNASIDGKDIVYHGYQDVGIAVSTEKGLVVPVLRDTDYMGLADIESGIRDFGLRARDGKLGIEEMTGGTFTITNGGVFGSLMSTPIINPPQAAILGMHKIQERAMVVDGQVVVRPMMYLALSYDHRLIDGKDSVQFLVAIKELLEDPARILLEL
ncbi:Dihydrolipoyllysine-residue succinyltransferase component of 2-oxoglutarate dehydrogenase complex [Sinobacterium norvegicum]|uniref:Dihydrolipoyllysine-residue succinyltransferase component of 2-oxoglutarate dehydrogenase complex n=1 Tax=Sinobacterium norvegicum TaxID=1641715 RepID=A0ABN8EH39_9GAMM|nr:2-oxoglutarate dehydrogenase complex dihydrolipoyllysine-residue succinyltransferase [Sinobacterium norvegicum]CAH0990495.1 Dihydrolipoyllysine-residue succinyltransferase component of 2-oxoglutarate dehydrogenase complex [Sinobacterium norvegicum]